MQPHDHTGIQWYCLNNICYSQIQSQLVSRVMSKSSGLMYAMPFPVIVWHGAKDVLLSFSAKDTIPVCPGNILTLFLVTTGIEICSMNNCLEAYLAMQKVVSMMYALAQYHMGISESQTSVLI